MISVCNGLSSGFINCNRLTESCDVLAKSAVKNAWGLREKDSVIILLDKTGKVQFVKEGKLTDDEVKEVISRVTALIAK